MTALIIAQRELRSLAQRLSDCPREVLVLGTVMIALQLLDGILTALGIYRFGLDAEANLIVRNLMEHLGYITALVLVKSLAITIVVLLCAMASSVDWLPKMLKALVVFYLVVAIIPWSAIHIWHSIGVPPTFGTALSSF